MTSERAPQDAAPGRLPGLWSLSFVVVSLVALAGVPIAVERQAAHVRNETVETLEPARLLGARLSLVQARQMARFQAFLLTGESTYRAPYVRGVQEEDSIYAALTDLVRGMDLDVRERVARLSTVSARWHVGHRAAFESSLARQAALADLDAELARYADLQEAAVELERAIQAEVDAGRRRLAALRRVQSVVTLVLVALAIAATAAAARVALRLRGLHRAAEERRRDAVRARREIDALLEATADGVLAIDLDGRCISINPAGLELLRCRERDLRGRDVHEVLHHTAADGRPLPRSECPILGALASGRRARSGEEEILWRWDRTSFPARWVVQPMVDGREVRGAVLTFTDMTEIRRKEDELRQAVRVRDEVVSIASHDLRNPLGVVAAAAELLLELPLAEDERKRQADIIRRSAERMRRLIDDLLDVARIEAGALVVRPAPEAPASILEEVASAFAEAARRADVSLRVENEEGCPLVRADRDRLHQALSNLVDNALKFTPPQGTITLSARRADEAPAVEVSVTDTGTGIAEEDLARLFDRFWQARRHDRTGAGLGLAIVRGVAEAHGGTVSVRSRPGRGTCFTLTLPAADASTAAGTPVSR